MEKASFKREMMPFKRQFLLQYHHVLRASAFPAEDLNFEHIAKQTQRDPGAFLELIFKQAGWLL
jgi:hypothetical protein